MRRLALATATFLALVTGAVTPAHSVGEPWYIVATVNATDVERHTAVYVIDGQPVAFPDKHVCEQFMALPRFQADIVNTFEADETEEHGVGVTIVWTCNKGQAPGQDI